MYGLGDDLKEYLKEIEQLKLSLCLCKDENKALRNIIKVLDATIDMYREGTCPNCNSYQKGR